MFTSEFLDRVIRLPLLSRVPESMFRTIHHPAVLHSNPLYTLAGIGGTPRPGGGEGVPLRVAGPWDGQIYHHVLTQLPPTEGVQSAEGHSRGRRLFWGGGKVVDIHHTIARLNARRMIPELSIQFWPEATHPVLPPPPPEKADRMGRT